MGRLNKILFQDLIQLKHLSKVLWQLSIDFFNGKLTEEDPKRL